MTGARLLLNRMVESKQRLAMLGSCGRSAVAVESEVRIWWTMVGCVGVMDEAV